MSTNDKDNLHVTSAPYREWTTLPCTFTDDRLLVGEHRVMMAWERPYMHHMVRMLHEHGARNILEVGFGMAISADEIQRLGVDRHTIIEAHPDVMVRARQWKAQRPGASIELIEGFWQDVVEKTDLGRFDGIFFDTYSTTQEEADRKKFHFFRVASEKLLEPGGALTFCYFNDVMVDTYQRHLYRSFSRVVIDRMPVAPPPDADYMQDVSEGTLAILAVK